MHAPMLAAYPAFAPLWAAAQTDPDMRGPDGALLNYILLGQLANQLVDALRAGETQDFPAAFAIVERWICEGDAYVREAAVIGLLEGLQNIAGNRGLDAEGFRPWLGPRAAKAWDELNGFWEMVSRKK